MLNEITKTIQLPNDRTMIMGYNRFNELKNKLIYNKNWLLDTEQLTYWYNGQLRSKKIYNNGIIHNEEGPASITFYTSGRIHTINYCLLNKLHRLDGPALITYDIEGNVLKEECYIWGKKVNNLQWLALGGNQS